MSIHRDFEIKSPVCIARKGEAHARLLSEAKPGPIVKWSSRGSGVVYEPYRPNRHTYFGLQLNRVARETRNPSAIVKLTREPWADAPVDVSRLSKRARRERAKLLAE